MTIDITPEAVERLATSLDRFVNETSPRFVSCNEAKTLRALSAALAASQAETAAAYEAAIGAVRQADASYEGAPGAYANIRALTPADSNAAMDRMIAESRAEGMREAAVIAYKFEGNDKLRCTILAAIPEGTPHE